MNQNDSKSVVLQPGEWIGAAESLGVGAVVILMLALAVATGLAFRGPGWINALNQLVDTILTHKRESRRINAKIEMDRARLKIELKRRLQRQGHRSLWKAPERPDGKP